MIYSQQVIADGASNYWRLNESSGLVAIDIIGGKNGAISAGVTLGQTGAVTEDKSMLFDGISGQINAGQVPNANYLAGSYTIEAWIYSTNPNNYYVIVSKGHSESPTGWRAFLGSSNSPILFSDSDVTNPYPSSTLITVPNKWQHVIWGYDAIAGKVFYAVNGVYEAIGVLNRSVTSTDPITISADSSLGYIFKGGIDEVAIYPVALTAAQISNHYSLRNSTSVGVVPLISPGPVTPLIQNVVYALPAAKCQLLSEVVCQTSSSLTGPFADLIGSNTESGKLTQGGFIRCATGNTNIVVKKHTVQKSSTRPYPEIVKTDGAIYYWRLNETSGTNVVDGVGGKNGTITGGSITLGVPGVSTDDKAMLFDGTGYITTPAVIMTMQWTQEAWIWMSTLPAVRRDVISRDYFGAVGTELSMIVDQFRGLLYGLAVGFQQQIAPMGALATTNVWHHIAMTHDGINWGLWWDGVLQTTSTAAPLSPDTGPLGTFIGSNIHDLAQNWVGKLQDIAIYPSALTASQIMSHFKAKKP
jgi:hypothetical protein